VQFKQGLRETGVKLEEPHCQALFRSFDLDCSGYVSFDEFLTGVRPQMNARRSALVSDVFAQMDVNNDGALTVQDVSGKYDCSLHPDVRAFALA
jgi:Ca2+-binding EF-hand superfamily protein